MTRGHIDHISSSIERISLRENIEAIDTNQLIGRTRKFITEVVEDAA
jgi:hypothetical protein